MLNLLKIIIWFSCCFGFAVCGCHQQETRKCESLCQKDSNGVLECELRGAVILPSLHTVEASIQQVSMMKKKKIFLVYFSFKSYYTFVT